MKPLVYIAGPITKPDPMTNTHEAVKVASSLLHSTLVIPFLPHLTVLWEMIEPEGYETWMLFDFEIIRHCHALLRMPGESSGADREVAHAEALGIPVFYGNGSLMEWARGWNW